MTKILWRDCKKGGYLSHSEIYVDKCQKVWWYHVGKLLSI